MEKIQLSSHSYLEYYPNFINQSDVSKLMSDLESESVWRDDKIKFYGKVFDQPRKVAFFGDEGLTYTYSKISMHTQGWGDNSLSLTQRVNREFNLSFNTMLLNLYRNGDDYMSWHCDDEPELGENPIIASLSLGEERDFQFRHKKNKEDKHTIKLQSGSLLLMLGQCQAEYHHQLPKRKRQSEKRINLTWRQLV